jgi:hypothetical protein
LKIRLKNISSDAKLYYIKGKIMHGKSKKHPRPCKIKKLSTGLELISDFTLNSDNYDIEVSYVVRSKIKIIKVRVKQFSKQFINVRILKQHRNFYSN